MRYLLIFLVSAVAFYVLSALVYSFCFMNLIAFNIVDWPELCRCLLLVASGCFTIASDNVIEDIREHFVKSAP